MRSREAIAEYAGRLPESLLNSVDLQEISLPADDIVIHGAREHNLKDVTVRLPRGRLICITGLSGSGKSSLAFDTLYAEGQRRYVESLSAYARQFLGQMDKPDVDSIEGLSPAISIDQKTTSRNPAVDGRHGHRDLRLSPAPVSPASGTRTARSAAGRSRDSLPSRSSIRCSCLPDGHALHGRRPGRARPQGRAPRRARRAARRGLHARPRRRRDVPDRGRPAARQEVQARHRGRGRPARDEGRPAQATRRLDRDGDPARRRARRDLGRRRRATAVLREVRVSRAWRVAARDGAARVQLQLAARCVSRAARASARSSRSIPSSSCPTRRLSIATGRARALEPRGVELLRRAASNGVVDRYEIDVERPVGRALRATSATCSCGARATRRSTSPTGTPRARPLAQLPDGVRGHRPGTRAPLPRDRVGAAEGADRAVHGAARVPGLPRRASAARVARRDGRRAQHRLSSRRSRCARR